MEGRKGPVSETYKKRHLQDMQESLEMKKNLVWSRTSIQTNKRFLSLSLHTHHWKRDWGEEGNQRKKCPRDHHPLSLDLISASILSLGLSWMCCVNNILVLQRRQEQVFSLSCRGWNDDDDQRTFHSWALFILLLCGRSSFVSGRINLFYPDWRVHEGISLFLMTRWMEGWQRTHNTSLP